MSTKSRKRVWPRPDTMVGYVPAEPGYLTRHAPLMTPSELSRQRRLAADATAWLAERGEPLPLIGGVVKNVSEVFDADAILVAPLSDAELAAATEPTVTYASGRTFYATDADYVGARPSFEHEGGRSSSWQPAQWRTMERPPCIQPCHLLTTNKLHRCEYSGRTIVRALMPETGKRTTVGHFSYGGRPPVVEHDDSHDLTIGAYVSTTATMTYREVPEVRVRGACALDTHRGPTRDLVEITWSDVAAEHECMDTTSSTPSYWTATKVKPGRKTGMPRKPVTTTTSARTLRRRTAESPAAQRLLSTLMQAADEARRTGWSQTVGRVAVQYVPHAPEAERFQVTTNGQGPDQTPTSLARSSWRGRKAVVRSLLIGSAV